MLYEVITYHYIDSNVLSARNIDLPRKVRYKKRRRPKTINKFEYEYRQGRTYDDFQKFIEQNPNVNVIEMDTVKGTRNKGKTLLVITSYSIHYTKLYEIIGGQPNKLYQIS